jgi:hypothetical protein
MWKSIKNLSGSAVFTKRICSRTATFVVATIVLLMMVQKPSFVLTVL